MIIIIIIIKQVFRAQIISLIIKNTRVRPRIYETTRWT